MTKHAKVRQSILKCAKLGKHMQNIARTKVKYAKKYAKVCKKKNCNSIHNPSQMSNGH